VYLLDTLHENSLLMAINRNRLLPGDFFAQEGSHEQVVCFLRFGFVGTDEFHGSEGERGHLRGTGAATVARSRRRTGAATVARSGSCAGAATLPQVGLGSA
jgi:hypothetical protein